MALLAPAMKQEQPQQAGKQEQAMFELAVKQAMKFLTSPEQTKALVDMARKSGPAKAVALFVKRTLDGVFTAAKNGGAALNSNLMNEAAKAVSGVLVKLLNRSGIKVSVDEVMAAMGGV